MSHLMIVEVAAGRESLPADPALVRLLARVDPPVGVEAGAGAELLTAEVTAVRSLPRVDPDVSLQQTRPVEFLPAGLTRQQSLGCKFCLDPRLVLVHHVHLQKLVLRLPGHVGDIEAEVAPRGVTASGG